MASRIMHYAIADILAKKIYIKDYNRFVFGALAPDMSRHDDGSYTIAHAGGINVSKCLKGIDWIKFYNKYQDKILDDDFFLGCFVHLIVDAYWLKHIQNKFIRKYSKEEKSILYTKGYRDMYNYNRILIDKYNLVNKIEIVRDIKIDEIDETNIEQYMGEFEKDFKSEENANVKFEIYPYDEIMLFIQNVCEKCICEVNSIRENLQMGNPEELFVEI
jgi:hypothetical protein